MCLVLRGPVPVEQDAEETRDVLSDLAGILSAELPPSSRLPHLKGSVKEPAARVSHWCTKTEGPLHPSKQWVDALVLGFGITPMSE